MERAERYTAFFNEIMKYTFNEVAVSQLKNSVQLVVEEMPEYADFFPTKKQKRYLGYLIVENDIKVTGDLKRLSNLAVSKLILEISKNEGKEITIISNKCRHSKASFDEPQEKQFFNDNSDLPF